MEKENQIISNAIEYTRKMFQNESSGHDFWHTLRVYNNATQIAQNENCDIFIVQLAALLHDVDDQKIFGGTVGQYDNAKQFMIDNEIDENKINQVCQIINKISYKGDHIDEIDTIEGMIVQDADRLDAIGAIGIARTFAFGGNKNREMYNPEIPYQEHMTAEEYKNNNSSTINHFYEKLLKLKDLMNTDTGKQIAIDRHHFMEQFLEQFYNEWEGKDLSKCKGYEKH